MISEARLCLTMLEIGATIFQSLQVRTLRFAAVVVWTGLRQMRISEANETGLGWWRRDHRITMLQEEILAYGRDGRCGEATGGSLLRGLGHS